MPEERGSYTLNRLRDVRFSESLRTHVGCGVSLVAFLEFGPARRDEGGRARHKAATITSFSKERQRARRPRADDRIYPKPLFFLEALNMREFLWRKSRRHRKFRYPLGASICWKHCAGRRNNRRCCHSR